MAQFTQLITTQKGQALIAKMLSGANNIKFSQVAVSDEVYELNQLESLTEILNIKQNVLVSKISRLNETTVKVEAAVNNDDLKVGYYMRTIGLYALDPDDGEILHAVSIETSGNCYIPPYNGVAASGAYLKLITTVGNAENISLEVDPAAVATVGDLLTKIEIDGDISDTVIETEEITDQFPVPEGKEKTKTFMGKVRKFIKDFDDMKAGIITLGKLVNNGQTTEPGFALDARYGKTLGDGVAQLNSDLGLYSTGTLILATSAKGLLTYERSCNIFRLYINGITSIAIPAYIWTTIGGPIASEFRSKNVGNTLCGLCIVADTTVMIRINADNGNVEVYSSKSISPEYSLFGEATWIY